MKSIRLTQEVFDYIDSVPGKGFNDKFEKIILEAKRGEAERKLELARLDKEIEKQRNKESLLIEKYSCLENFFRDFVHIYHQVEVLKNELNEIEKVETKFKEI